VGRAGLQQGVPDVGAHPGPVLSLLRQVRDFQGLGCTDRSCRVNPSDLAVIAVTVLGLANIAKDYRVQMRVADRLRIVSPPAAPKETTADRTAEKPQGEAP
jgi:hypothetical protein